jgi:hypothetical protein
MRVRNKFLAAVAGTSALICLGATASAAPFTPVIDEFWIVKNSTEIFRDSFNDGIVPVSGPDGAATYINSPTSGIAGFTSESGGKLTMTPALGTPTLVTGTTADTFTGGMRAISTNPLAPGGFAVTDDIEIRGLFDMSNLPTVSGQQFGIRFNDRTNTNTGDDIIQLSVGMSSVTGNIIVRYAELDFAANTSETAGVASIQGLLPTASQIELVLHKAANSNQVDASYIVYDVSMTVIGSGTLDNFNDVTGLPLTIYNGENFSRAQFFSTDTGVPIPAPASLAVFGLGVAAFGALRRRKA